MGRYADTHALNLGAAGVVAEASDGKIKCVNETTNVPHIYAIGDVLYGQMELTPVAIKAGRLLARRLFNNQPNALMDYDLIPTTVFSPVEYGCCGLTEEQAIARHGADNIEVYWAEYSTLELDCVHRIDHAGEPVENQCLLKMICLLPNEKVIGYHVVSPHAGEITQGVATAMRLGATKEVPFQSA
jgi:thioredoxin reductase (NADPH)